MSNLTVGIKRPPLNSFTLPLTAVLGAMFGFVVGNVFGQPWIGALIGALVGAGHNRKGEAHQVGFLAGIG